MAASSSSSSTSPSPRPTPSTVELRTWLLDCALELSSLERKLSRGVPAESLQPLSTRLALISEILAAQRSGLALESAEQQLLELLLTNAIARVEQAKPVTTSLPNAGPELELEPRPPSANA